MDGQRGTQDEGAFYVGNEPIDEKRPSFLARQLLFFPPQRHEASS
jgi:hypothetical protein